MSCAPANSASGSQAASARQGQTTSPAGRPVHVGIPGEPTVIASKFGGGGSGAVDFPFIFHAQLTQFDPDGVPMPVLVQEVPSLEKGTWRLLEAGRMETTYRLRPGLTWHDGTPFTAEDVVFTWRAIMNPALPAVDRMPEKYVDDVEVVDPQTMIVRWGRPYIYANAWDLQPVPRHIVGSLVGEAHLFGNTTYWTTDWVGLGPYRLTEWIQGSHVRGEAFTNFALGAPNIQTVVVHIVPDANQAVAQMLAGALDVTLGSLIRPDEGVIIKEQLEPRREASIFTIPTKMRHGVFQFRDPTVPWVRDGRVRQAMMYALDRQAMADSLMQGYSQIADMYIAPSDPLFPVADRAITKYAYDPSRAAQLLGQAGWTPESDGLLRNAGERFDFEVRTTQDVQGTKEAQLLADMWKRVGLNTSIFVIPRTEQRNQEYRAKFPGMTTTSIASVEAFYYTSDTIPHEGNGWQGTNRGGYSSAEADRLDHAYFTTIDPVQRRDVLIEILRFVSVELPYLAFYYNVDTHAVRAGLHGIGSRYDRQPGMAFNIYDWYWEQGLGAGGRGLGANPCPRQYLKGSNSMALVHSVCNFCHVRCPTLVDVQDDRVASLESDSEHPYGGLLCVKGKAAGELLEHPDRVLYPLKRVGPKTASSPSPLPPGGEGNSQWVRVSWDEALADIAAQLLRLRAEHGPETIVFSKGTRSGTGLVDAERWLKRLSNLLGTPNTVATTHLCQWPRDEGTRYTFGVRMPTPDLERAGCFLLWGCNPSTTNIRMAHDIQVARARGMKLVTVDPRRVGVAAQSDVHLAVQPGTDGALALSLAHFLVESGRFDEEFVRHWTNAPLLVRPDLGRLLRWSDLTGRAEDAADFVAWSRRHPLPRAGEGRVRGQTGAPVRYATELGEYQVPPDELDLAATPTVRLADGASVATATVFHLVRELLHDYPPERTAEITGVPADSIRAAADLLAAHRPVAHYFWNGITQHTNAAQNGRAISLLYALLGDFDAPGGNVITPRPAIADVELNSLLGPDELERRLGWEERPLGAPRTSGSSAAYDVYRAVLEGDPYRVRALLAFGTNMVMTNGGSLEGRAALEQLEFMVCVDYFLTPTAQLADYVLPAATFLEAPSLVTGWELPIPAQTHLQYRPPAVSARGEARSDTQIIFDLAVRLGFGDHFWQGDLAAAFRHELEPSGITLEELHQQPLGIQSKPGIAPPGGRSYARGAKPGFNTPTRKVELYATPFAAHGQNPLPAFEAPHWSTERQPDVAAAYPFVLTNAKVTQFCHGQHRALPSLRRARPHPEVELHPETAAQAGVAKGAWVAVETPEGAIRARVRLNAAIKPGVVVGQHGWWQECAELGLPGYSPYAADGANVNLLISNRWRDPISGGTPFRSGRCRLRLVDAPAS